PDRLDLLGSRPAEIGRAALAERLGAGLPAGLVLRDGARAARGAPEGFAEAAAFLVRQTVRLKPGAAASLSDRTLSLRGEAASVDDYAALRAALTAPPPGYAVGEVAVEPALAEPFTWSVARGPEGVRLAGYTVSEADRAAILAAARLAADGAPVVDAMRTARGLPAGLESRALIARAFAALALVRDGRVTLEGGALSIRGAAIDAQAVREADALTTGSLPPGLTRGDVDLTASPVSPYVVSIRRGPDAVTLSGHLPDAESRAAVLAALRPLLYGERVVDRTRLAEGAPPGLVAALTAAVGPLALLASGEVTATDTTLRLAGESLYAESARRLSAAAGRLGPPGWRAEVAVGARDATPAREPSACRDAFAALVAGRTIRFDPGSAELRPAFYPVLDDVAALARTCPSERIEVAGHDDPPGTAVPEAPKPAEAAKAAEAGTPAEAAKPAEAPRSADARKAKGARADAKPPPKAPAAREASLPDPGLPQRRAAAIVDYLLKAGVPASRIAAAPAEPRPERRAVEFALRS
ncbi:OmpA family protein, partial [Methylobacterium crusticola]